MKKKVVVTGGAGFIGSNLVNALISEGFHVVSIDNYSRGDARNLSVAHYKGSLLEVKCDVRDKETMRGYFKGADCVFHQAALKNTLCHRNPSMGMEINVGGTLNVLELALECGVDRFLFASTASVYGRPVLPIQDEEHPLAPVSFYGVSKLAAEGCVRLFKGLNTTILRYFHVYGSRCDASDETGDVIPIFIRKLVNDEPPDIHGDGLQERSYTYVGDIVKANLLAMYNDNAIGKTYNCASGLRISVRDMVESLRDLMGKKHIEPVYSEWRAMGEPRRITKASSTKIGYDLGLWEWTPFDVGLKETVEWYQGEGRRK